MYAKCCLFFSLLTSLISSAAPVHNHDEVIVQMAYESGKGLIEVNLPAHLVLGFEHAPRNPRELKKSNEEIEELKNRLSKWFSFSSETECLLSQPKSEIVRNNPEHSEVKAQISLECKKPLLGQKLQIQIRNTYPNIKTIKVEALIETLQKSWLLNKKQNQIEFK